MAFKFFKKKKGKDEKKLDQQPEEVVETEDVNSEGEPEISEVMDEQVVESEPEEGPVEDDEAVEAPDTEITEGKAKSGFFSRLKKGLTKTRDILTSDVDRLFLGNRIVDEDLLENLEELLITSDIGVSTSMDIVEKISKNASRISNSSDLKKVLKKEILELIETESGDKATPKSKPHVMMVVGVNGVGKTTTIGKLAAKFKSEGKKVLIVAADTFRAAASDQLTVWAERAGVDIVKHKDNSDPAAVAFDGISAAITRDVDVVIVDTAGRLHTKVNLMEELKKIRRAIGKKIADAPHETLIVLDATTGQNALSQAKMFNESIGLSGIALTKLDGTAKGGIVIGITSSLKIPLKYIGIGEKIDDLQEFDAENFVDALF